jgi:glyoxylase-like metal-dependent hydrolase (beta-lactamase superfamily II)
MMALFPMRNLKTSLLSGTVLSVLLLGLSQTAPAAPDGMSPERQRVGPGSQPPAKVGPVEILRVRSDLYMLTVADVNVALQVGADGAIVVDTGPPRTGDAVVRAIEAVTDKPIRYVINTSADPDCVGNNAMVAGAGSSLDAAQIGTGVASALGFKGAGQAARITAYQNVINTMLGSPPQGKAYPGDALPGDFYDTPERNFYLNDQGIKLIWQPAAHSNGDTVVVFRRDDVVVTGHIFDQTRFPVIDLENGGSIQGEIDAINRLMDTEVIPVTPLKWREGPRYGTLVIPGRGPLSEQAEMVQYRDMLQIIRDRIAHYIRQGKTLAQVEALRPAAGYEPLYGATTGAWTTAMFVEAVYRSLRAGHADGSKK